jgi:hypothetical protein
LLLLLLLHINLYFHHLFSRLWAHISHSVAICKPRVHD